MKLSVGSADVELTRYHLVVNGDYRFSRAGVRKALQKGCFLPCVCPFCNKRADPAGYTVEKTGRAFQVGCTLVSGKTLTAIRKWANKGKK